MCNMDVHGGFKPNLIPEILEIFLKGKTPNLLES